MIPPFALSLGAGAVLALLSALAVGGVRRVLLAHGIHDAPNARSSHTRVTPRGAGIALVPLAALAWIGGDALAGAPGNATVGACLALALGGVALLDDLRGLPPAPRFAAQIAAVSLGLSLFDGGPVFQGLLPLWLDRVLAGVAWLWFINLFNFMDGIDAIAGAETLVIAGGLIAVGALAGWPGTAALPALWLVAVSAGFLVWNRPPARIFLGETGATGLGVLLGWLLLEAAARGAWPAALLLPGYYWADASLTLLRRLFRGAKIWHPHREHAYQRAVRGGWPMGRVSALVAGAGAGLMGAACAAAAGWPAVGLAVGALLVAGVLAILERAAAAAPRS